MKCLKVQLGIGVPGAKLRNHARLSDGPARGTGILLGEC